MKRKPWLFSWLAGAALLPAAALAQGLDVQIPRFEVLDPQGRTIPVDQSIVVHIKGFIPAEHAGLRARFFRGEKASLPRMPHDRIRVGRSADDQCFIYNTWEAEHVDLSDTGVDVGLLPTTSRVGQHWVVVFEEGEWKHGLIKISSRAVADYFKSGYEFVVVNSVERRTLGERLADIRDGFFSVFTSPGRSETRTAAATLPSAAPAPRSDELCIHFKSQTDKTLVAEGKPCAPFAPARGAVSPLAGTLWGAEEPSARAETEPLSPISIQTGEGRPREEGVHQSVAPVATAGAHVDEE